MSFLIFLAISALGGGFTLIISPSGKLIGGLPLSILDRSPFNDFLIPGILLFIILGLVPAMVVLALIKRPNNKLAEQYNFFSDMHWSWSFSIYTAFALIIWIQVETIYIQGVGWLQTFYMFLAIAILFVALLPAVREGYKR